MVCFKKESAPPPKPWITLATNTMPKKKKDKKKGDKKGKAKAGEEKEVEQKPYEAPDSTYKEVELKKELDELNLELGSLKKQVNDLRAENEWLQGEAEKTKLESQDYQTYVSRKAKKRETLVVTLSDSHQMELREIERQKEELLRDYEETKTDLSQRLLDKEHDLSKVLMELEKLQPFKDQQQRQEQEIAALQRQLDDATFRHEDYIRRMKTQFLQERRAYDAEMAARVKTMTDQASKQASECLQEHTAKIRIENQRLRAELKQLIETTNDLQLQKKRLIRQYHTLLREHQLNRDLQRLRGGAFGRGGSRGGREEGKSTLPDIHSSAHL